VKGNDNPANAKRFEKAVDDSINDAGTQSLRPLSLAWLLSGNINA
jgi:hypothetical protein